MSEPDAELHLWTIDPWGEGRIVRGMIFGDRKSRFADGEDVNTSFVQKIERDILRTKNTTYRLVPREETAKLIAAGRAAIAKATGAQP
jgi:hypothetical protein